MDTFVAHYPDLGLHLALLHMLTFDCDIKTGAVDTINLYEKNEVVMMNWFLLVISFLLHM